MRYTNKARNVGLDPTDFKIIDRLRTLQQSTIKPLAESLSLPRTTVSFRLQKLIKREWVQKIAVGNHAEYQISPQSYEILFEGESDSDEFKVQTFRGIKNIWKAFEPILYEHGGKRGYFLETPQSWQQVNSKFEQEYITHINTVAKQTGYLSEGISPESVKNFLRTLETPVLQSLYGQTSVIYTVPDELLQNQHAFVIFSPYVYIADLENEQMVRIKNKYLSQTFIELIKSLQLLGKRFNINDEIRSLLTARETSKK